jgi:hypothetical protein
VEQIYKLHVLIRMDAPFRQAAKEVLINNEAHAAALHMVSTTDV